MAVVCRHCGRQYDVTLFEFGNTVLCDCGRIVRLDLPTPGEEREPEPFPVPIEGTLDLHTFKPSDVKDLVPEYLRECRERGILRVRIVHGKGTGALMKTVHAALKRIPEVASFRLAGPDEGGSGATIVELSPPS